MSNTLRLWSLAKDRSARSPYTPAQISMTPAAAKLHDAAALNSPDSASSVLDLTIFVSCYNESQYIANTLDNVRTALAELRKFAYEIVVIDDSSTDDSPRAILDYLNRYPHERIVFRRNLVNIGWAQNYIDAAFIGCGKYFRVVCGDESEPKQTMIDVFNHIGEADILVPYYALSQGRSLYRLTMSQAYTALVNLLSGFHLRYYNGLHVHLRYNVMRWHSNTRGFGFQADILCLLLEQGFSYKEIPVVTIERKKGRSTALSFRNILSVIHTLFDIAVRRISNRIYGRQQKATPKRSGRRATIATRGEE
jgi:glycosyltransferase involved in cell wall biosynthesis